MDIKSLKMISIITTRVCTRFAPLFSRFCVLSEGLSFWEEHNGCILDRATDFQREFLVMNCPPTRTPWKENVPEVSGDKPFTYRFVVLFEFSYHDLMWPEKSVSIAVIFFFLTIIKSNKCLFQPIRCFR